MVSSDANMGPGYVIPPQFVDAERTGSGGVNGQATGGAGGRTGGREKGGHRCGRGALGLTGPGSSCTHLKTRHMAGHGEGAGHSLHSAKPTQDVVMEGCHQCGCSGFVDLSHLGTTPPLPDAEASEGVAQAPPTGLESLGAHALPEPFKGFMLADRHASVLTDIVDAAVELARGYVPDVAVIAYGPPVDPERFRLLMAHVAELLRLRDSANAEDEGNLGV